MKKIGLAILIAAMGIVACSNSNGKTAEGQTNDAAPQETTLAEAGKPIQLNKQMFLDQIMDYETNQQEWVYKGDKPGLVDFYADWCRPCKITSPILDELAKEYEGKINIYKVNVDKERELAAVFGVQSIPTFLFMPQEGMPTISAGIAQTPEQTKEMFRQQIEELLLKDKTSNL